MGERIEKSENGFSVIYEGNTRMRLNHDVDSKLLDIFQKFMAKYLEKSKENQAEPMMVQGDGKGGVLVKEIEQKKAYDNSLRICRTIWKNFQEQKNLKELYFKYPDLGIVSMTVGINEDGKGGMVIDMDEPISVYPLCFPEFMQGIKRLQTRKAVEVEELPEHGKMYQNNLTNFILTASNRDLEFDEVEGRNFARDGLLYISTSQKALPSKRSKMTFFYLLKILTNRIHHGADYGLTRAEQIGFIELDVRQYMKHFDIKDYKQAKKLLVRAINEICDLYCYYPFTLKDKDGKEKDFCYRDTLASTIKERTAGDKFLNAKENAVNDSPISDGVARIIFKPDFVKYLSKSGFAFPMDISNKLWKLDVKKYPLSFDLGMLWYLSENNTKTEGMSVKWALENLPELPTEEAIRKLDRNYSKRRREPFEKTLDYLQEKGVIPAVDLCTKSGKKLTAHDELFKNSYKEWKKMLYRKAPEKKPKKESDRGEK
jgi:hypothetical protein